MLLKQYICDFIKSCQINNVFGVAGTMNIEIASELDKSFHFIQNVHEANCVYSAIGGYLATQKIHFVLVISGPGVSNLMTALGDAYMSKIPIFLLSIAGNSDHYGLGNHHSVSSLQDGVDTTSMTETCTCFSILGLNENNVSSLLPKAYNYALEYKQPVHISIPGNLLDKKITLENVTNNFLEYDGNKKSIFRNLELDNLVSILYTSKNPIIITSFSVDNKIQKKFIKKLRIIFANTMKNINFFCNSPYCLGNFEYIKSNKYIKIEEKSDLLIFLGNSLNKYFLGNENFYRQKTIIHISESILDRSYAMGDRYFFINSNINDSLIYLSKKINKKFYNLNFLKNYSLAINKKNNRDYRKDLFANFLFIFNKIVPEKSSLFVDVGFVNNYVNMFLKPKKNIEVFLPGVFLNMGQASKIIGYSFYNRENPNFIFIGDGSFFMNMFDIKTAVEQDLNINFIVFNNMGYRSLIDKDNKYDFKNNFCKYKKVFSFKYLSQALGVNYYDIKNIRDIRKKLKDIDFYGGVNLIEIKIVN